MADLALDDIIKNKKKRKDIKSVSGIRKKHGLVKRLQDARQLVDIRLNARLRKGDARQVIAQRFKSHVTDARQLLRGNGRSPVAPRKNLISRSAAAAGKVILPTVKVHNDHYRKPVPVVTVKHIKSIMPIKNRPAKKSNATSDYERRREPAPRVKIVADDDYYNEKQMSRGSRQFDSLPDNEEDELLQMERLAAAQALLRRRQARAQAQAERNLSSHFQPTRRSGYDDISRQEPMEFEATPTISGGYRVEVLNLHPNVTKEDIFELFTSIGPLRRCSMPRPGRAEIVFSKKEDALAALRRYDKRELDGQPMNLKLVEAPIGNSLDSYSRIDTIGGGTTGRRGERYLLQY